MEESAEVQKAVQAYIITTKSKGTAGTQTTNDITRFDRFRPVSPLFRPRRPESFSYTVDSIGSTAEKAVGTVRYRPVIPLKSLHNRGNSLQTDYRETGKAQRRARIGGVLGTNREFLQVKGRQRMQEERTSLQQSLALTRKDWKALKYCLHSQSLGLTRVTEKPRVPQHSTHRENDYLRTWKTRKSPNCPTHTLDCNLSYRRVLSTAQSSRCRKVSDVTWRSQMNTSPTKQLQSEGEVDLSAASVTQYLQWHRSHPKAGLRLSQRRASDQQEKGRNPTNAE